MIKKILTVILSAIMISVPVASVSYAQETVTDGGIIDVSFEKNADTVIEAEGEKLNASTWFAGLGVTYSQYGAVSKAAIGGGGEIIFDEIVYNTSGNATEKTGKKYSVGYSENNGLDSMVISNKGTKSFEAALEKAPTASLLFAVKFEVGGSPVIKIKYSDNSTQSVTINGSRYAQAIYNSPSDAQKHAVQKAADGSLSWAHEDFRLVGLKDTGYTTYKISEDFAAVLSQQSQTIGVHLYEVKLDSTKIPVSVSVEFDNQYHMVVYSIAQNQLTNSELLAKIQEAELILDSEITASDIDKIMLAGKYADILAQRNYSYDFSKIKGFAFTDISVNDGEKTIKNGEKNLFDVNSLKLLWRNIIDTSSLSVAMTKNGVEFTDFAPTKEGNTTILTFDNGLKGESEYKLILGGLKADGKALNELEFVFYTGGIYKDITVDCTTQSLVVGESANIKVYGQTENDNMLELSTSDITFSSDDASVISVDSSGKLTAHKKGTVQITVVFKDPVSENPYADSNNCFTKTLDFKAYIVADSIQGNREKISFAFGDSVTPVEAYFSEKETALRAVEAEVSFNASENIVDVIPSKPLDLSKEYIVTLVTDDMVYNKNIAFEILMSEDFSASDAYNRFSQNRGVPDTAKYVDINAAHNEKTLLIAEGQAESSLGYKAKSDEINSWKDYTVEFEYLTEKSGYPAKEFIFYFLSNTDTQVEHRYDKKQAATISTTSSYTSYFSNEPKWYAITGVETQGDMTRFSESDLTVSGAMLGNDLFLNVRNSDTEELLYSQKAVIPIQLSELNRRTGTFALAASANGSSDTDALVLDNIVCYKTNISEVEYSASIPFNARDLYNVNEIKVDWNYNVSDVTKSDIKITENGSPYTDFKVSHENNCTVITFLSDLKGEGKYLISFENIVTSDSETLNPMDLSFFMGGIYKNIDFSDNRFVEKGKSETLSVFGTTDTDNTYALVNDYIEYISENTDIFTVSEDGVIEANDRGFTRITAVYTDPNTQNPYAQNGKLIKTVPVYSYMSKAENIAINGTSTEKTADFDFKNGVVKLEFTDDLSKNMSVGFGENNFKITSTSDKYVIGAVEKVRTAGNHIFEIIKNEGKILAYLDGEEVVSDISAENCNALYVSGDMQFDGVSVYNLIGSVCKADFVNVRLNNGITGDYNYIDSDNDPDTKSTYRWLYSDTESGAYYPVAGQTSKLFTASGYAGKYLKFEVTPANNYETGVPVVSSTPYRVPVAVQGSGGTSSGGGSFGGSSSSGGGFSATGSAVTGGAAQEVMGIVYKDVTDSHWAFDAISSLTEKNTLNGFTDGTFRPDQPVTRAEFICAVLKFTGEGTTTYNNAFSDIVSDDWYAGYVQTAYNKGYVLGDGTNFNPDSYITRQEMAVMIYRIFDFYKKGELSFSDKDSISEWAAEAVSVLTAEGILNGKGNNMFEPLANTTRAEMAVILERIQK